MKLSKLIRPLEGACNLAHLLRSMNVSQWKKVLSKMVVHTLKLMPLYMLSSTEVKTEINLTNCPAAIKINYSHLLTLI